jgi:hypothetical protein
MNLSSSLTQRNYQWPAWKIAHVKKGENPYQHELANDRYTIWFYDGPEVHITEIWVTSEDTDLAALHLPWKTEFESKYLIHSNRSLVATSGGRPVVSTEKTDKASITFYSHDWTDKTTWRESAVRINDEPIAKLDNRNFKTSHSFLIDTYHGKMTNEDFIKDSKGNSYRVFVKVDGVTKQEQDPHVGAGADYIIDYDQGLILFLYDVEGTVTASYHYATSSILTIRPAPGKKLTLAAVECQFSLDVEMKDTAVFHAYGNVISFAPHLAKSNGGPYPDLMKIPLGNPLYYKSISDFQNDAFKAYPTYPALGGDNWRGCPQPIIVFDWDYLSAKALYDSKGMELRISLQHDEPFGGYYATATFYCGSEDE